jgi:hypothetical protein
LLHFITWHWLLLQLMGESLVSMIGSLGAIIQQQQHLRGIAQDDGSSTSPAAVAAGHSSPSFLGGLAGRISIATSSFMESSRTKL